MGVVAGGALVAGASLAGGGAGAAPPVHPGPIGQEKVRGDVVEELADQGRADVLVRFGDRPDLASLALIPSWEERGRAVYDALRSTAEDSQAGTRAALESAGVEHESFFISNAILVHDVDEDLLGAITLDPEVEGVHLPAAYELPEPVVSRPIFTPAAVEWGVAGINADDVWSTHGTSGEGIVVATIDTGVDHTHPALVNQYRGNQGDGTFTHDYNWFDAGGVGSAGPVDLDGHGTHVMGTLVGDDGGSNQIGVAPGARWIATNGCCSSDAALIASGEWLLAPTDLDGQNPMPSLRPHVVNNSWGTGFPSDDPFMEDVEEAWQASGIFATWSNGNLGPGCRTSSSPGSGPVHYSVGAHDAVGTIAAFSSRGSGQAGSIKPDITAPGTNVRSSAPGGGYRTRDGTSSAAPHVSGAVALLWASTPRLVGDIPLTRALLDRSAVDAPDTTCGGTAEDNNVYGEGRLDVLALLDAVPPEVVRVAGADRYGTAAAVSRLSGTADTAFVASGEDFPDALAAAARAGSLDAPVLLAGPTALPAVTTEELLRLQPQTVVVVGGPGAVSAEVEGQLAQLLPGATVTRRGGADRYGTAAAISGDLTSAEVVHVATGADFPDALAGAARAGTVGSPVLLVQPGAVPSVTRAEIERLAPERIVVLGGPVAVSEAVADELGAYGVVERIAGPDRYGTAAQVAADLPASPEVLVATGQDWPDALAGAARAGAAGSPVLLVSTTGVPSATSGSLDRLDPDRIVVLGGPVAVDEVVVELLRTPR